MYRGWHKLVVLVLLALAFIDVAGICPVDAMNLPSPPPESILISAASLAGSDAPFSSSEGLGDGCFCFCAHMILAPRQTMDVSLHSTPVDAHPLYKAIEAPPASPYHPPRS